MDILIISFSELYFKLGNELFILADILLIIGSNENTRDDIPKFLSGLTLKKCLSCTTCTLD